MKIKHNKRKHAKINYGFVGFEAVKDHYWYNLTTKTWGYSPKVGDGLYSTIRRCNSVRAFRRMLKSAPKGVEFILLSIYKGYDVYGKGSKKLTIESHGKRST
jgi:hypothetical protein